MNTKIVIALLFPTILFSYSCINRQEQSQSPVVVKVVRTTLSESSQRREFPFIAKPLRTSELSFRVSGPIDRFDVYAGNYYKRGNIIAEIDSRDFRLRHENAEAAYRRAKADYERIEALYQKDNVSASNYETARAVYVAAKTAYDRALNELNDTKLIAPFDGYVGEVYIEKFQEVKASQPIVSLADISKLRIEIYVTQDIAMQVEGLRDVGLRFDNKPNQVFNAQVVECARSTTPNNLSYLLTALLPNPDGKLPAGLSGKVFFDIPGTISQVVAVPQSAVCHRPTDGDYVWIVDSATNKVSKCPVTLGELLPDSRITIKAGLAPNKTVAVSGLRFLSDGITVKVSDTPIVQPLKSAVK